MPLALNQICRAFSSTLTTLRTGQFPLVIWFFTRAGRAVVQIQVVPAVALRHPDDLLAVVDVLPELLA